MRTAVLALAAGLTLTACANGPLPDPQAPANRVDLVVEGPIEGVDDRYLVAGRLALGPFGEVPRHVHDGEEFVIVTQGSVTLSWFADLAWSQVLSRELQAGEGIRIPPETVHWARAGEAGMSATSSWIVVRGKPLRRAIDEPGDPDR